MAGPSYMDGWGAVDRAAPDDYVRSLEQVNADRQEDPQSYAWFADLLGVREGHRLLEVGCGLGGASRALSHLVGPSGRVVGIDNSEAMIVAAQRRTAAPGLPVDFQVADAHELPFGADTFDGCWAESVFIIVHDPRRALAEMVRVAKPGAVLVVTAPDLGTLAIDSSYRATTRAILQHVCEEELNGWVGRQLPGLARALGLRPIRVLPEVALNADHAACAPWLRRYAQRAEAAGAVSADEATAWLEDLEARAEAGTFFTASIAFAVAGRKP